MFGETYLSEEDKVDKAKEEENSSSALNSASDNLAGASALPPVTETKKKVLTILYVKVVIMLEFTLKLPWQQINFSTVNFLKNIIYVLLYPIVVSTKTGIIRGVEKSLSEEDIFIIFYYKQNIRSSFKVLKVR